MIVKGYRRRGFRFLVFCHHRHSLQGSAKTIDRAAKAHHHTGDDDPHTPVKPLPQPYRKPYEATQRNCHANAQLGQPDKQIQIFHRSLHLPVRKCKIDSIILHPPKNRKIRFKDFPSFLNLFHFGFFFTVPKVKMQDFRIFISSISVSRKKIW